MCRAWLAVLLLSGCCASAPSSEPLVLHTRARTAEGVVERTVTWDPARTAIIVCDMWDDHWCAGAARRVGELATPLDAMLADARARGVFVIHAPSSVVSFYEGTPQRVRAQEASFVETPVPLSEAERWGTNWCWPEPEREPDMPIDDSDMGCDCEPECELREAWTRQHATLQLDPADALTDDGQETWNLLEERGIEHVVLCGVHLNMCVLGRPFAIRQMVNLGKDVVLMRDMTDSMYDRDSKPFVDHFSGTDLVVEHVERHWCPSMESTAITGRPAFRFAEDER
jgi:nicotinamidase-related amidase